MDLISPIFDLSTKSKGFMEGLNPEPNYNHNHNYNHNSGSYHKPVKRSVSETKKKYVASMQDWKCGQCTKKLSHTFEIDHKIRLEHGGGNDVGNLVALCRECHGEKTAMENM
jgi:5-methylcytosine-specific restriction endonuclease McrA